MCYMFHPPYANYQVYITHSTHPSLPRDILCFMPRISSTQIIMIQLQTTQQTNIGHVNKSPPNHSLHPFHNNHPPKRSHSPYSYCPTHIRYYSTAAIVCTLLYACYYISTNVCFLLRGLEL